jgi:hypothetical protein
VLAVCIAVSWCLMGMFFLVPAGLWYPDEATFGVFGLLLTVGFTKVADDYLWRGWIRNLLLLITVMFSGSLVYGVAHSNYPDGFFFSNLWQARFAVLLD